MLPLHVLLSVILTAEETANLTQQNIIQQATATILTQANQRPQVALNLLNR